MALKAKGFDLLSAVKNTQTPLFLSLLGFRKSLSRHLGLKAMPLIMHDNLKAALDKEDFPGYPYGYFRISSLEVKRDGQANKTLRRHGSTLTLEAITNAVVQKGYLFPCEIMVELHFIHNDSPEVLLFIEKCAILGAVDGFSFQVDMPGSTSWTVGVTMEEGPISIPDVELESESDAAAFDISVQFRINTRAGIVKNVPKINNEGKITKSFDIDSHQPAASGESDE